MHNIMAFAPNPTDATSLYRAVGPLQMLRRSMAFNLSINPEAHWATMKAADLIFAQRIALDHHVRLVNMAVINRKPIMVDYDDDLYQVPICNRAHDLYSKESIQNNITAIIAKADIVTVSTQALAQTFRTILGRIARAEQSEAGIKTDPRKVVVVPNAYDTDILPMMPSARPTVQRKLIAWRGSNTHDKDLMLHTEALVSVIANNLDWTYNFIGEPFWWTLEQIDAIENIKNTNVMVCRTMDPIEYFEYLRRIAPGLMIVPLENNGFNRAKSNIAWIEATHAGSVVLAPDFDEWRRPGVITYNGPEDFKSKLESFMAGQFDDESLWKQSADFIRENLLLPRVNQIRAKLIKNLITGMDPLL